MILVVNLFMFHPQLPTASDGSPSMMVIPLCPSPLGLLEQEGESPQRGVHLLAIMARMVSGSTAMAAVQT